MKTLFTITCLLIATCLQAQTYNREFLQNKVQRFNSMKNTGIVMTAVGAASAIGGIIALSGADWEQNSDGYETNDENGFVGAIFTTIGVGLMAGGITCIAIGDRKSKKYKKALNELTIIPLIGSDKTGLMLTFRF
jgi:hypothetical protein